MAEQVIYISVPVYPKQEWSECPNNNPGLRHDIDGGNLTVDDRQVFQEITCTTCGLGYTEVYAASHRIYPVAVR